MAEANNSITRKLHWLPVEHRMIFKILFMTFKIIDGCAPE